jgi:CheY-like chemotaxis protein
MKNTIENTLHILLADDDSDDSFLFNEAVEQSDLPLTLSRAEDGNQLLSFLEKEGSPDILFLDVNMPYKNGIECLHEIRSNAKFDQLPIVIYSTTNYKVNIDACFEGGADFYVVKPNSFEDILKMIRTVCNKEWWRNAHKRSPEFFILNNFLE